MEQSGQRILWGVGTSRTLRAHWILAELELDYVTRPMTSRSGETSTDQYSHINPSQKIPTFQDGYFTLSESAAIVNYVATRYGQAFDLAPPTDPQQRALYDQWCFFVMMELDAHTLYVIRKHGDLSNIYGEAEQAIRTAREGFQKQANAAAKRLDQLGPYVLGARFSGADILLTSCLNGALRRSIELPDILHRYLERTTHRTAYSQAMRANQIV